MGKVTPKGETASSPEEKLLRSIFGEKATDVRDTSLKLPPGSSGVVVDVRVFNRHGVEKDERAIAIERYEIESVQEDKKVEEEILNRNIKLRVIDLLNGKSINKQFKDLKPGTTLNINDFENLTLKDLWKIPLQNAELNNDLEKLKNQLAQQTADNLKNLTAEMAKANPDQRVIKNLVTQLTIANQLEGSDSRNARGKALIAAGTEILTYVRSQALDPADSKTQTMLKNAEDFMEKGKEILGGSGLVNSTFIALFTKP